MKNTFPKEERLRKNKDIKPVFIRGKVYSSQLIKLYISSRDDSLRKAGFILGRVMKGSVQRNRLRRLLREAYRLNKNKLGGGYNLLFKVNSPMTKVTLSQIEAEFMSLVKRAGLVKPR